MMKTKKLFKFLTVIMMLIFSCSVVMAQNVTITGKVTSSDDGLPIPGASIVLKGTTRGVSTDMEGLYEITVPRGSVLQFSSVGMADQEVAAGDQTVINIILQPSTIAVDEVVVTALGISREKKALGYSVTEVAGDKLTINSAVSPVSALQGRAAGVLITNTDGGVFGGTRINIRGNSTLKGNNQPIYIVDGVVIDNEVSGGSQWGGSDWGNNLKNLNPDDFETVSILKGAAATALYGSRALNGVILITTKKGKATKGIGLEITHTTAVESAYVGHDFQDIYGVGGLAGYCYELPDRFAPMSGLPLNDDGEPTVYLGDWGGFSWGPKMSGQQVRDYDDSWTTFSPQPKNMIEAMDLGIQNNTNVALSGANSGTNYHVSYSFKDHKGVYPGNETKRNSLGVNVGQQLVKWLRLDVNMAYVTSDNMNPPSRSMYSEFIYSTFPRSYNTAKFYQRYQAAHGGVHQQAYGDPLWNVPANGMWFSIFENISLQTEDNTRVRVDVTANITPWLTAKFGGNYNEYAIRGEYKSPGQGYQNSGGSYQLTHSRKFQTSIDGQLIAQRELFDKFNAMLVVGGENYYTINSGNSSWTNGGLVPPLVFSLSASRDTPGTNAWVNGERQLISAYYIANFDYKGQFYIDLTGRNDWSSTMVYRDGSGHYSYFYPSFTGSWLFSETFKMPAFMDFGKVRLAYAIVGTGAGPYDITNPFTYTRNGTLNTFNGSVPYYTYSTNTVPNPDLQPEKKHELEFGLDVRFFKNRLGLDLTLYNNHTYNQILSNAVPSSSGVSGIIFNAGDIQNKGIEITLHTSPVRMKDLTWDADFNFTRNRNMIIDLYEGIDLYGLYESATYGNTRIGTYAVVGGEWGVLMSDSQPLRDEATGLPLLRWSSGNRGALMYRSGKMEKVGTMNPDFFGSVNSTITWKNLQLGFLIDAKIGGMISSYHGRYGAGLGVFESTLANRDAEHGGITWTSPWTGQTYQDGIIPDGIFAEGQKIVMKDPVSGVETTYNVGGMTYQEAVDAGYAEPTHVSYWVYQTNSWGNGVINENVLMENSYICLREVSLGYRLPDAISNKIGAKGINILLYGRNLGYLYNTMTNHLHPEAQTSNEAGAAHEWMQIPYTRTMGIKLNLNF
jgi:iron complex outermembrane receptor protein